MLNTNLPSQPIPPEAPLPSRKIIRSWLIPLAERTTMRAIVLLAFDYALLFALLAGAVLLESAWLQLLCGLVAGFVIGRLFILGHDACHQSYTPHRGLNKWLGRIAFMPSLTPYSLWDVGHNVVHHGYTNLKGVDFVWSPSSVEEYKQMTPMRRMMERIYRSGWAPWLYYMVEIWWNRMYFPNKEHMPTRRSVFIWDNVLVSVYGLLWIGAVAFGAHTAGQNVWLALLFGFVIPFVFWNGMIGIVVYMHHTHVKVAWYDEKRVWAQAQPFVSTTVHLTFKRKFGALMHHIMEHTAHHVDMSVPLYRLKEAQKMLENLLPERIVIQPFSWRWYFETARLCKLYDFKSRQWLDFSGRPTSAPVWLAGTGEPPVAEARAAA